MDKLNGKVALITGGAKGIGFGIAKSLVDAGIRVCLTGRDKDSLDEASKSLNAGRDLVMALGIHADVRSLNDMEEVVHQLLGEWGKLDIVVANAGVGHFAPIGSITVDQWQETLDTNLTGVFYTIRASLESLKTSKGYLITIASLAGTNFFAGGAAYNASKFGLVGFTQAVMLDLRQFGIKTTTIMPGSVSSFFNGHVPGPEDHWKIQPEDMGQLVTDLLRMPWRTLPSKVEVRPTQPG